jgi:plasmid stabilization system protein ParE
MEKRKIEITEDAKNDLEESVIWYESKKNGLGKEFKQEVKNTIKLIDKNPLQFQKVCENENIRRAHINRFPFFIFYLIQPATIKIFSVFHTSKNPDSLF